MVSAVAALLYRYTGNRDILVASPIYKQDIEGEFINTVFVLRNRLTDNMTFKELLLQVKQTIVEAVENQNYPIKILMEQLNMPLTEAGNLLFDSVILLENIHDKKYIQNIMVNMVFSFSRTREQVSGKIEYNASLYKKNSVELLVHHFTQLLQTVLFSVDTKIPGIQILSQEEKNKILYEFNKTGMGYPNNRTIHTLFEEQVEKIPYSIGVVYGEQHLTYEKLNKKANQLAHLLRIKGVKADSIVGIMVERSLDMIIGILGILKAGGAYLPIDPFSPKKRILFMLEECLVSILVTRENIAEEHSITALQALQKIEKVPYVTAKRQQITNFDQMPIPDRSLVDYGFYNKKIGQAMFKNSISLQASRGCPYHCLYCHKIWPKKHVFRSAEHIFEEVLLYYKLGVRRFAFVDDIFNLDKKNSSRFFQLVIKNKLNIQIAFPNGVRGDILTKDYIDLMVEAGTSILAFALETASPRLQKLLGKNLNLVKFRENIEYYCEKYPRVILELFTMHGFPSETKEEAMMTLNFIKSLKWLHFPFVFILKIYPNTDMAKFAVQQGISLEQIHKSDDLLYNELPGTLPFEKSFTLKYQSDFLNNYFLLKERLLYVLPHQMNLLSEDEIVQAYNGYLPNDIYSFQDLLDSLGITKKEPGEKSCRDDAVMYVHDIQEKMRKCFPSKEPGINALRVLLLDVSQFFSKKRDIFYDVIEPPLGLMYLMTYLKRQFGTQINGKVVKSRIDFDNYEELKKLLEDFKADVIGIRSLTSFKDFFHKTAAMIRHWGIDAPVIAGGPYATSSFQTVLQDRNVDLVVLGEGEVTFNEIIGKIIENNGKLPDKEILKEINGIAFIPGERGLQRKNREIVILDELTNLTSGHPDENLTPVNHPQNLAYTIFTSGSTGKPKGVPITHANLSPLLHWGYKNLNLSPKERVVQNLSYFFDWSVWEIFMALTSGANLHMVRGEILLEAGEYIDFMKKNAITVLHITPTQWQSLIAAGQKLETLKYLCIGAEKLSGDLLTRSYRVIDKNCRVFNMYGPTEATIITAILEIMIPGKDKFQYLSSVPIGQPVANAGMFVLDENLNMCPINLKGELYIAGDCLARGYLNEPGKTSEKFIKNVYPAIKGECLYRTGDIVRWLPDGTLQFAGRMDHQVKIRGFRIELGEIENQLSMHRDIKDAVVTVTEGKGGNKILCAYFVPAETNSFEEAGAMELKAYLSKELPGYMIPGYFMPLNRLPLTPNGKVDRKALPVPEVRRGPGCIAPGNSIEKKLVETWSEVLGIDKDIISITDSFFELGGDSLQATRLTARIHKAFNVKLPLAELFKNPTIKEAAVVISKTDKMMFMDLETIEKREFYELSYNQKRLWIINRLEPGSSAYHMHALISLKHSVDKESLKKTLYKLIKRHESLRTGFREVNNEPVQFVIKHIDIPGIPFKEADISFLKEEEKKQQRDQIFAEVMETPFDFEKVPLFRSVLLKLDQDQYEFLITIHHIVSDGWSIGVLKNESFYFYEGPGTGKEVEPEPLKFQYKDFTAWHNRQIKDPITKEKSHQFWLKKFDNGLPVLKLPGSFKEVDEIQDSAAYRFLITREQKDKLEQLAKEYNTSLFTVMFSVFNILLSNFSGQEDILCGIPAAGRDHISLQSIIGFFVNTLIMKTHVDNQEPFNRFLEKVSDDNLEMLQYQNYPLELSFAELKMKFPEIPVFFNMLNRLEPMAMENPDSNGPYHIESVQNVKFDMAMYIEEYQDFFEIQCHYRKALFKPQLIEHVMGEYIKLLDFFGNQPGKNIEDYKATYRKRILRKSM
jgi:amino acid adenylation domain-containing protein